MTGQLPQIHEGRDGERQRIKLLNQMRQYVPAPTASVWPVGSLSLLTAGQTLAIPVNVTGWVTTAAYIIPDDIVGAQAGAPIVRIGSNATFDNVAPLVNLGLALVADTVVPVTLVAPMVARTDAIYFDVATAATGPTTHLATIYIAGFYR